MCVCQRFCYNVYQGHGPRKRAARRTIRLVTLLTDTSPLSEDFAGRPRDFCSLDPFPAYAVEDQWNVVYVS